MIYSKTLKDRSRIFAVTTLHERMMIEAETIVQHFWMDVAKHDKDVLAKMPSNSVALWWLKSTGSYLCPLYSHIDPYHSSNEDPLGMVDYLITRIREQIYDGIGSAVLAQSRFYIVRKGITAIDGSIQPISLDDVFSLVFDELGQLR